MEMRNKTDCAFNSLVVPAPQDYMENGRLYHGFRKGIYMYPCDEV